MAETTIPETSPLRVKCQSCSAPVGEKCLGRGQYACRKRQEDFDALRRREAQLDEWNRLYAPTVREGGTG